MKLDVKAFKYLGSDDWRVLTSVELGSKNHEVVPTQIISQIANLRGGITGTNKSISALAKSGLIAKVKNTKYDGYRLTYGGLDYLALHAHIKSGALYSIGPRIGVGKESDIYACCSPSGTMLVLKLHRLGRISFRAVKNTRDYLRGRKTGSWLYLSRLAAAREFAAMQALYDAHFPVPRPVACNRHAVLMERIDGLPLYKVNEVNDPGALYESLSELAVRLAKCGVIHGDLNEFNIMLVEGKNSLGKFKDSLNSVDDDQDDNEASHIKPVLIDFPQIISTTHTDAAEYFARDISCLKRYFGSKLKYDIETIGPTLEEALNDRSRDNSYDQSHPQLDIVIEAAGFSLKKVKELEELRRAIAKADGGTEADGSDEDEAGSYDDISTKPDVTPESELTRTITASSTEKQHGYADNYETHPTNHSHTQATDNSIDTSTAADEALGTAMAELRIRSNEEEISRAQVQPQPWTKDKTSLRLDSEAAAKRKPKSAKSRNGWAI